MVKRIILIVVALLIVGVAWFGFWFSRLASTAQPDTKPIAMTVEVGDGVRVVADKLFEAGYIRQRWHWNLYIALTGRRGSILSGQYFLQPGMTIRELAVLVTTEPKAEEITVKLLEGWTAEQMADVLDRTGVVAKQDFLDAVNVTDSREVLPDRTYGFLADKPESANLEGFLFPDTYRFFIPSTPAQVLAKLLDNFDQKFTTAMRTAVSQQGRSTYDVITLASIVERELQTDADRAMAADLFLRRIEAGIPLQSDATVNYVTGKSALRPTFADLEVDSPYNTYKYAGFPPGPIGNPGVSALRASVNPEPNDYYYFLTGTDGKTYWARTLEEHNQNRARYLE